MALSFAVGRGQSSLAHVGGSTPLVAAGTAAIIGRRGPHAAHGSDQLASASILDIPAAELEATVDFGEVGTRALERITDQNVGGFWIHVDADVLNPKVMPAVGAPEPGGPMPHQLVAVLGCLVADPRALGLSLSIYDPALDPDRSGARQLVNMLVALLAPATEH
jgi:arginase